jgi:hypothetical protein
VEAVAETGGGDVIIFHASTPSAGIGALQAVPPEGAQTMQQEAFYEETLCQCIKGGVAVNTVVAQASGVQLDLHALQYLPWRTGGDALHLPNFNIQESCPTLVNEIQHWAERMQSSAYGCVFKLRCSKGLRCSTLFAPWPAASSSPDGSAFELPRLTPDTTFAISLQPELDPDGDDDVMRRQSERKRQLFIQAAVLYTNGEGDRLLRIHTTMISVAYSVRAVYQSVSMAPLIAMMLKQAAVMALDRSKSAKVQPKDHLLNLCLQILAAYRRHCYTSDIGPHCLVVCKTLCLLPLYTLAARKLIYYFNLEKDETCRDDYFRRILRMPIHSILVALYPRAHALPVPTETEEGSRTMSDAIVDSRNLERAMATPCPLIQEHVVKGPSPAYLIANGFDTWLLTTESGASLGDLASQTLVKMADKAREHLQEKLKPSLHRMALGRLPPFTDNPQQTWQEKVRIATLLVEDEGGTEMSYCEWVEFLQGHIMNMVRG